MNGKLIILGFFGVCPEVDVQLHHVDQPAILTFLVTGGPGDGEFPITFAINDDSDGRLIAETAEMPLKAIPAARTTLAPTIVTTFGYPGTYAFRCLMKGQEQFRATFKVSRAPNPIPPT